ncbi:MAG: uroporphyrinogen decarboxylase [Spirochaetes bacterium]|nr:uroporphyrinogen decarboxylase [Spirochaetota bacterium]
MLTKRQNLLETIKGGKPDRFVNQYEAFQCAPEVPMFNMLYFDPYTMSNPIPMPGTPDVVNSWGVTISWPANVPGMFPVHDEAHKVVKDIAEWQKYVKAPNLDFPQAEWDKYKPMAEGVDRNEVYATYVVAPGVFEQLHYLMGMDDCLLAFYEEPDALKELIEFIANWEVEYAKLIVKNYKPNALFHHDDWGSYKSSFISPEMFKEFIVPAYKKIYGFWKDNGVELIIHHSDSYAANLVPSMIDVGIDIWQGCSTTNNVPDLVKKYGEKISFMGDIDSGVVDKEDWTPELVEKEVRRACETNGKLYFIPNTTQGGPMSTFPGLYEAVTEAIDKMSKEMFKPVL